MAIFAIGDVQGCIDDLERLLERLRFDPAEDRLWFSGDLVNRGPGSLETLRLVRSLGDCALTVLGNHDLHLLSIAFSARPARHTDTIHPVLVAPDRDELLDWLRRQPLLHHDSGLGYTLIHAGLPPQWDLATAQSCAREVEGRLRGDGCGEYLETMYGDDPALWSEELTGLERLRFITNALTRMRYCDRQGRLALHEKGTPGTQTAGLLPWFAVPGRASAELHILFGHWSTLGPVEGFNVYPLDTGCVWGGNLTAFRLDEDGGWISVPCQNGAVRR